MTVTADALDLLVGDPPRFPHVPGDFHRHPTTGAPYVTHPETGKRVMYGRPSSFGSALDNPFNLVKWKERKLVEGIARQEQAGGIDLLNLDDRGEVDGFIAYAYDVAETHLAADQGTHIHRLCEAVDKDQLLGNLFVEGEAFGIPEALQRQIVNQWHAFRERLGIRALAVEQTVVNDRWRLAGTLDRLDVADRDILTAYGIIEAGVPFVGDIKTGGLTLGNDGQPSWWTKYPVQLAAYVDAVPYDTERDERLPWPVKAWTDAWDRRPNPHIALIYHYDLARALAGEVVDWQIIPVNVDAGREGGDLCRAAADFAKRRDLFAMPAPSAAPAIPPVEQQATDPEPSTASTTVPGSAVTREGLRDRIRELIEREERTEALFRLNWPEGVPTLKHDGHTDDQLEQILALVRKVEAEIGVGWNRDDARHDAIARARQAWAESGRGEDDMWFCATLIATYEQCRNVDVTIDGLVAQFTIEQADRLRESATNH